MRSCWNSSLPWSQVSERLSPVGNALRTVMSASPNFPGKRYEDWDVADPAGRPIEVVRDIRDDIQARVVPGQQRLCDRQPAGIGQRLMSHHHIHTDTITIV